MPDLDSPFFFFVQQHKQAPPPSFKEGLSFNNTYVNSMSRRSLVYNKCYEISTTRVSDAVMSLKKLHE